uniref:Serpin domain-containing protein n=2 Tax=Musca domestica TaxID=7370 RepID=A0A1I8MEJ9_MUSDO
MWGKSIIKIPLFVAVLAISWPTPMSTHSNTTFKTALSQFGRKIFNEIQLSRNEQENHILSPFAIQACLAMLRLGAEGKTAQELERGLNFPDMNIQNLASNYHTLLATYQQGVTLKIANKIYVKQNEELNKNYNDLLSQNFYTTAENIDFTKTKNATKIINDWIASKTDNMIENLISEDNITPFTKLYILSAIHFKGKWATAFPQESTTENYFYMDSKHFTKVQMMKVRSQFKFGFIDELESSALLLPYKDSNLSMLIILPNAIDGLSKILKKLTNLKLADIISRNVKYSMSLDVHLPKFKAEFKIKLSDVLKKMGMEKMFSSGEFGNMLKSPGPLALSEVIHQASIEVNEEGTKAAAVAAADVYLRSSLPIFDFNANHPFYYAIINDDFIPFFEGTFVGV